MANKLDTILPKVAVMLRVAFGKGVAANEREKAFKQIHVYLECAGSDGNDLAERVENSSALIRDLTAQLEKSSALTKTEVKKIYDKGRADEAVEQKRRAVTVPPAAPTPFFSSGYGNTNFSSVSSPVTGYVRGSDIGVNGYGWGEIAQHCAENINCFPDKHREFVTDMADDLSQGGRMSAKQAKYLGNLFSQYLRGRID